MKSDLILLARLLSIISRAIDQTYCFQILYHLSFRRALLELDSRYADPRCGQSQQLSDQLSAETYGLRLTAIPSRYRPSGLTTLPSSAV